MALGSSRRVVFRHLCFMTLPRRLRGNVVAEAEMREYGLLSLRSCGVSEAVGLPNDLINQQQGW